MKVQVNTDKHIDGHAGLISYVEAEIADKLSRFAQRITRVEVHLTDESSAQKSVGHDKRCVLEARLAGLQPISVRDDQPTVDQALHGAITKMRTALDRILGRQDRHRNAPIPGEHEAEDWDDAEETAE